MKCRYPSRNSFVLCSKIALTAGGTTSTDNLVKSEYGYRENVTTELVADFAGRNVQFLLFGYGSTLPHAGSSDLLRNLRKTCGVRSFSGG